MDQAPRADPRLSLVVATGCAEQRARVNTPAAGSSATDGLQIGRHAPKVGDKRTKVNDQAMVMAIAAGELTMVKHTEETREILAVDGDVITKVKMYLHAYAKSQTSGGKTRDLASVVAGKAYIVSRQGGAIEATVADGSPVSAAELEELTDANKRLGKPNAMEQIVASKTWKVGEKVVFSPDELAASNKRNAEDGGGEQFTGLTMTLTAVEAGVATFAMEIAMAVKLPNGSLGVRITGASRLDVATGRALEVGGTGPLEGNLGEAVTGTMTMKDVYTY